MKKNKFQIKRETTYQMLLEAGMKCFAEKGYAATTLNDIVARTGQTKGAFYGHFTNKEQFFTHVLDHQIEMVRGWNDIPEQYNPANATLEEVIVMTLTRLVHMLGVDNWITVLIDFYQQTRQEPELQTLLRQKYGVWISEIEVLVGNLQERGWIAPDKDVRQIAMQVIAFNEGYTIFSALFGGTDQNVLIKGLVKLMS
ncbi:TetR/AcrR family transcriptional regulator [Paenibacillus thalictri]|uniref:TetR/AcrR family transcriptional regulator n=1 Tax=Paenibacillus thalictri TaxID=2527873 RepID=A0A4V2J3N1_9BACL|nr:TetR/AcrR family transcriptional regulator [Paenibacillus thalictri]TBL73954.1 TetR/AcrR family transcriptional regulator [Paenibacillus thalictri]